MSQRTGREAIQRPAHPFEDCPQGGVVREIVLFARIVAGMEKLLAHVALAADVLPVALRECGQRTAGLEQLSRVRVESVEGHHFRERRPGPLRVGGRR